MYEMYQDTKQEWRWRFKGENGEIIAVSSEGYVHKTDCFHSIYLIRDEHDAQIMQVDRPRAADDPAPSPAPSSSSDAT